MTDETNAERSYSLNLKLICNALALRPPQRASLEIFARLCNVLSLKKNTMTLDQLRESHHQELDSCTTETKKEELLRNIASNYATDFYADDLEATKTVCERVTSFERNFPSVCFALATGIGKTRLMGACIAYLHNEKGFNNFLVIAPNLTIYEKLKEDLSSSSNPKYVFRGLDTFVKPPRIVDGDNYNAFRRTSDGTNDVIINIFNISKLNADSAPEKNTGAKIKRLNEVWGESYFSYLQSLKNLCVFMDESHHYHADRSFDVINELNPILGVEFTATPYILQGTKKQNFKNIAYEYTLASALNDKRYVKIPVVYTRRDFNPSEYTPEQLDREKLIDGIHLHRETKSHLEIYARTNKKPLVKPFALVVAKDTSHSKQLFDYVTSDDFFGGYYKGKVLEINSSQGKVEKDENIENLLSLEKPENTYEIVIHVNMLKEGWDVTNLYTIIPLRASASDILTEQTLGRGLRLPYGERTGEDEVDRLSIVSHDRYEELLKIANDENSLVRRIENIDDTEPPESAPKVIVEMPSAYDSITSDPSHIERLERILTNTAEGGDGTIQQLRSTEQIRKVTEFVADRAASAVIGLNKRINSYDDVGGENVRRGLVQAVADETISRFPEMNLTENELGDVVRKAVEVCVQALTDKVIPIPQTVIGPFSEVEFTYREFKLNTHGIDWYPSENTIIGHELQEKGRDVKFTGISETINNLDDTKRSIVQRVVANDDIDYEATSDLIYSLVDDVWEHLLTYLSEQEAVKVMSERQKSIADEIYIQMKSNLCKNTTKYRATEMLPFSRIETSYGARYQSDEIYDLRASLESSEVRAKIFKGFEKACHTLYKFDSNTERIFAIVLETDSNVIKWLRPSPRQFNIHYGPGGIYKYEPDFIVETETMIYMAEPKARNEMNSEEVLEKAKAGLLYCETASKWNSVHGGKPWTYVLIPHDEIRLNSSFKYLVDNYSLTSFPATSAE